MEKKSQLKHPQNTLTYLLLEFSLYSSTNIINPLCHELIMMYKLYSMFMILTNISLHSNTKIINQLFHELILMHMLYVMCMQMKVQKLNDITEAPYKMMNKGEAQSQF